MPAVWDDAETKVWLKEHSRCESWSLQKYICGMYVCTPNDFPTGELFVSLADDAGNNPSDFMAASSFMDSLCSEFIDVMQNFCRISSSSVSRAPPWAQPCTAAHVWNVAGKCANILNINYKCSICINHIIYFVMFDFYPFKTVAVQPQPSQWIKEWLLNNRIRDKMAWRISCAVMSPLAVSK